MTDRGLKKKHHRMTPIEHFLIDIIQILFRDWIQSTIDDIGRCKATTDIFQPTLRNYFDKRWLIIFFFSRGCFFVRWCRKYLQCRSARFFSFELNRSCVSADIGMFSFARKGKHLPTSAKKHDSPILIEKHASQRRPGNIWPIEV